MNSNRRAFLADAAAAAAFDRPVLAANDKHSRGLNASGGLGRYLARYIKQLADDGVLGRATMVEAKWHWYVVKRLKNCPFLCTVDWNLFPGSEVGVCSMALRAAT